VIKLGSSTATLSELAIRVGAPGRAGANATSGSGTGTPAQPGVARLVHP
jgi:hypothetical protein